MKILFIGGTKFVGRQMVEDAIKQGHEVHLLHRGQSGLGLFTDNKKYLGDRKDIASLIPKSEKFDFVVDCCGYHPDEVEISAKFFKDRTNYYVYISSTSVYAALSRHDLDESADLTLSPDNEYGRLKALCEKQVINQFGLDKSLILRPIRTVGALDYSESNFTTYIKLVLASSQIDVPNDQSSFIQFIDVRALSQFALTSIEKKRTGIYNLVAPRKPMLRVDFFYEVKRILSSKIKINLVDRKFKYTSELSGNYKINAEKAYLEGLIEIPLEQTILAIAESLVRRIQENTLINTNQVALLTSFLDQDSFDQVRPLLDKNCIYEAPKEILTGPEKIITSYKNHSEFAKKNFEKVVYESSFKKIKSTEFEVTYKDILSKNGHSHTYCCKQFVRFNSENLIFHIRHEEIPGQYEAVKEFYRLVGVY